MEVVCVVKVVIMVCSQYTIVYRCQCLIRTLDSDHWESESGSRTSIVTIFKASITEKNSTQQYSFQTSDRSGGMLLMVRAIYSAGLSI